jgi:hypothetical protein
LTKTKKSSAKKTKMKGVSTYHQTLAVHRNMRVQLSLQVTLKLQLVLDSFAKCGSSPSSMDQILNQIRNVDIDNKSKKNLPPQNEHESFQLDIVDCKGQVTGFTSKILLF